MAKTTPPTSQPNPPPAIHKLPRLPKGTKIHKRPLLHPAIASPRSSLPKTVYISASSPFISSLKRVRKYLAEIDRQQRQRQRQRQRREDDVHGDGKGVGPTFSRGQNINSKTKAAQSSGLSASASAGMGTARGKINVGREGRGKEAEGEEVLIKATGKAIEKALRLALYFQGQEDCVMRLRTGTVGAVDDLVVPEIATAEEEEGGEGERGDDEEVPETRLRRTSMLEVGVSLR